MSFGKMNKFIEIKSIQNIKDEAIWMVIFWLLQTQSIIHSKEMSKWRNGRYSEL